MTADVADFPSDQTPTGASAASPPHSLSGAVAKTAEEQPTVGSFTRHSAHAAWASPQAAPTAPIARTAGSAYTAWASSRTAPTAPTARTAGTVGTAGTSPHASPNAPTAPTAGTAGTEGAAGTARTAPSTSSAPATESARQSQMESTAAQKRRTRYVVRTREDTGRMYPPRATPAHALSVPDAPRAAKGGADHTVGSSFKRL